MSKRPRYRPAEKPRQRRRRQRKAQEVLVSSWVDRETERERIQARRERVAQEVLDRLREVAEQPPREDGRRGGKRPRVSHKDFDALVRKAWEAGWRIEWGGKEHLKVYAPEGEIISVPSSPSRQRTLGRLRSAFRRGGLEV